ncbi:secretion protein HlyD [Candidatus Koribacter versatilis Ellin345]|uniref:Secretion protein HlyD n=1 Tax=Koribacter versatilis (strain Ellin345) TaxID=204669 RepID=Q1IQZ9_KORVE|nr:efflux RND transporter periplasmic adaptor subunit [Candidatus Koribacter versatilis]ABF40701.1 secretion protein HlyD [Candidatus Koribacter versatilis Ellin345]
MQPTRKRALLLLGAASLCAAIAFTSSSCSSHSSSVASASSPPRATVAIAKKQPIGNSISVAGEFLPYQEVEIHAKVAGYIRHIGVDIGDRVHTGQELAVLEVPELTAQVEGANAGIKRSQQEITRTKHQEAQAEADHQALHAAAIRLKQASEARPGLIAEQELDDANAKDRASEAQVEAAKAAVAASEQGLDVSRASKSQVSAMSDYSRITAPFDGVVTWRYSDTGALVQAGTSSSSAQPVVKLAEVRTLRLRIPVPESVVPSIHQGQTADVVVSATSEHFTGRVARYTDSLDRATRTMQVEIDVPNPQYKLSSGMYAQVTLHTDQIADALSIPVLAVHRSGDKASVLVVNSSDRIEERAIAIGIEEPNFVQVLTGLKEGERVVVGNASAYQVGELVSPKESSVATVLTSSTQGGSE